MSASTHVRSSSSPWAFVPAVLLIAMVGGLVSMAIIAGDDPGFALERDYYAKAVNYDGEIAQRAENARLGWRIQAVIKDSPGARPGASRPRTLVATIQGVSVPITGARVVVQAIRNASAARILEVELPETPSVPGEYRAALPLEQSGLYEFRFTVTEGNTRYTESVRLDVPGVGRQP